MEHLNLKSVVLMVKRHRFERKLPTIHRQMTPHEMRIIRLYMELDADMQVLLDTLESNDPIQEYDAQLSEISLLLDTAKSDAPTRMGAILERLNSILRHNEAYKRDMDSMAETIGFLSEQLEKAGVK